MLRRAVVETVRHRPTLRAAPIVVPLQWCDFGAPRFISTTPSDAPSTSDAVPHASTVVDNSIEVVRPVAGITEDKEDLITAVLNTDTACSLQDTLSAVSDSVTMALTMDPAIAADLPGVEGYIFKNSPVGYTMRFIESLHDDLTLPWWGAIVASGFMLRLAAAPIYYRSIRSGYRMSKIAPQLQEIQARMKSAQLAQNHQQFMIANEERKRVMKANNVSLVGNFIPLLVQLPIFICFIMALRRFSLDEAMFEGWTSGGLSWWSNLAARDPYWGLPLLQVCFNLASIQVNPNIRDNQWLTETQMRNLFRGFSIFFLLPASVIPAGTHVYFTVTSITMFLQVAVLNFTPVKSLLGLPSNWPNHVAPAKPNPDSMPDGMRQLARLLGDSEANAAAAGADVLTNTGLHNRAPPPPPDVPHPDSYQPNSEDSSGTSPDEVARDGTALFTAKPATKKAPPAPKRRSKKGSNKKRK